MGLGIGFGVTLCRSAKRASCERCAACACCSMLVSLAVTWLSELVVAAHVAPCPLDTTPGPLPGLCPSGLALGVGVGVGLGLGLGLDTG